MYVVIIHTYQRIRLDHHGVLHTPHCKCRWNPHQCFYTDLDYTQFVHTHQHLHNESTAVVSLLTNPLYICGHIISTTYNTGARDLPDIFVFLKPDVSRPKGQGHIHQANHEHPRNIIICMYLTSGTPKIYPNLHADVLPIYLTMGI